MAHMNWTWIDCVCAQFRRRPQGRTADSDALHQPARVSQTSNIPLCIAPSLPPAVADGAPLCVLCVSVLRFLLYLCGLKNTALEDLERAAEVL
jgi:hypothetical protein